MVKPETLGDRIKKRTKEIGLTQKALAKRAGLSSSNLNDVVKGRSDPGINKLQVLARYLRVDLVWLIYGKTYEQRIYDKGSRNEVREGKTVFGRRTTDRIPGMSSLIERLQKLSAKNREIVSEMVDLYLRKRKGGKG